MKTIRLAKFINPSDIELITEVLCDPHMHGKHNLIDCFPSGTFEFVGNILILPPSVKVGAYRVLMERSVSQGKKK